jgi:hypothetical protein
VLVSAKMVRGQALGAQSAVTICVPARPTQATNDKHVPPGLVISLLAPAAEFSRSRTATGHRAGSRRHPPPMNNHRNVHSERSRTLSEVTQPQRELANGAFSPWPKFPGAAGPAAEWSPEKGFFKGWLCSSLQDHLLWAGDCLCPCFPEPFISECCPHPMQALKGSVLTVPSLQPIPGQETSCLIPQPI